ncbi:hypothetical protein TREAZ_1138 [Leadbettera azotonutricia ZAS-9]|uniref:Uncharacterized protein n=1 Tax=Leadbettera azotonutricia (strain ATCC BAA-888 / DSM 13862 / ZAS-9) TaxID=545695 RepID=F5Y756_LEAAZ|nr:hypothetical protein TREAZ_1138 [Leadbettera azotonutricia ZAS-9]
MFKPIISIKTGFWSVDLGVGDPVQAACKSSAGAKTNGKNKL